MTNHKLGKSKVSRVVCLSLFGLIFGSLVGGVVNAATDNLDKVPPNQMTALEKATSDAAFSKLMKQSFPLTPVQIHSYKNLSARQEQASSRPHGAAPLKGTSNIISVSLKPGSTMPLVRVGQGQITSLVFTDQANQTWPIKSYSVGDKSIFNVTPTKEAGILMIQSSKLYGQSNMAVILSGLQVPVYVDLIVGASNSEYDYMDYIQVPGYAGGSAVDGSAGDPNLLPAPAYLNDVLQDITPRGAKLLPTDSNLVKVWRYGSKYLVTTRADLISPRYKSKKTGTKLAGSKVYKAYEIKPIPVMMISVNGSSVAVNITDNTVASDSNIDNNNLFEGAK